MRHPATLSATRNTGFALTMTQNATSASWGFTQPDCRGAAALLFFMDDLARVVNQYLGQGQLSDEALSDS